MVDKGNAHQDETTNNESEQFWEGRYQQHAQIWSGKANPVLVDVVEGLAPGRALDLGCGEGGDAIWLAQHGWHVTAVDVSHTALERAAAYAAAAGVADRIEFQQHDLARTFPAGTFDLISAQYFQSPVDFPRDRILQAAAHAVALGGLLLIVSHASVGPWAQHAHQHPRFPTLAEELAQLNLIPEQWRIERQDIPARQAKGPNGETATVADNVLAVRRLAQ